MTVKKTSKATQEGWSAISLMVDEVESAIRRSGLTIDDLFEHNAETDKPLGDALIEFSWVLAKYQLSGCKDYEVSLGLAERLAATDLRGIQQNELRLPFEAIKIFIPKGFRPEFIVNQGCPLWVAVYIDRSIQQEYGIRTLRVGAMCDDLNTIKGGHVGLFDAPLSELKLPWSQQKGRIRLFEEKGIKTTWEGNDPSQDALIHWLANVVLYITMSGARGDAQPTNQEWLDLTARLSKMHGGPKKERLKERRRSLDPGYKIFLGRDVLPLGPAREGTSPTVRTLVQGHWRNQACGPKFSERKLIWIEPFWRGPDLAEATNPIRVLQ